MNKLLTLVTGAGGFVGSEVTRELLRRKIPVRAMVRRAEQAEALTKLGAEVVIADLSVPNSLKTAVNGVHRIVHVAASFRQAGTPNRTFKEINVDGTKSLLDCAISAGVKRFLYCSTVGVHGHVESPPANEESPLKPGDAYQISKLEGEKLVRSYFARGLIRGAVIRPAMVYGPNDKRTLKLFKMVARGTFFYVGQGKALVHFIDVRDLARAFADLLDQDEINDEVFIIAGNYFLELREVISLISSLLGVREPWIRFPVRPMQALGTLCEIICAPIGVQPPIFRRRVDFFTKNRAFNCEKARRLLNFKSSQNLIGELTDIISSYIADGSIKESQIKRPSVIVRSLDGMIKYWDDRSAAAYGWPQEKALGEVSHTLLQTSFPSDLNNINSELKKTGRWKGQLNHQRKDGQSISVSSIWHLLPSVQDEQLVAELNHSLEKQTAKVAARARAM